MRDRLDQARRWSEDARALLVPPVPVTPAVLKLLDELSTGAEELNLNLAEQEVLDGRLGTVRGWLQRAKAAMESNAEWQELMALVKEAKAKAIDLPEVKLVAEQQAEEAWRGQAALALEGSATIEDLEDLVGQSGTMPAEAAPGTARASETTKALLAKLEKARAWAVRLDAELAGKPTIKDAAALLSDADADGVTMELIERLRVSVADAKAWLDQSRRSLNARSTRGVATRASFDEALRLYEAGQALPLTLPEVYVLAAQLREAEVWTGRAEAALAEGEEPTTAPPDGAPSRAPPDGAKEVANGQPILMEVEPPTTTAKRTCPPARRAVALGTARKAVAGTAAARERLRELLRESEALSISVGMATTLQLRSWRQEVKFHQEEEGGGLLDELANLLEQGRTLGLDETPRELGAELGAAPRAEPGAVSGATPRAEPGAESGAVSGNGASADSPATMAAEAVESEKGAEPSASAVPTTPIAEATAEVHDGARGRAEWRSAAAEWAALQQTLHQAGEWKARAERVLTTEKVALTEMRDLTLEGQQLHVLMPEQAWLERQMSDAETWLASADVLQAPTATLDELSKCVKQVSLPDCH